ncbi:MAG TPA: sigma-70 family RNA polymerase sigma factor [Kiritimatiellia bacterium]|nr:sigma-70 family RNA polymerase sigma factor [Kiritimatiellia bacterium]
MIETRQPGDEEALVLAAQAGDAAAFEALVRAHLRQLRAFIALRAPVAHLVDEVAHDTFVHAHRHLREFTAGTSLRAWLRAIAFNLLRAEIQRHAREQAGRMKYAERVALEEELASPAPGRAGPEADALEACVRELPDESRRLLQLKYTEALESDLIGRALQRSTAWVRTTLFRIRELLRLCVEERLASGPGGAA